MFAQLPGAKLPLITQIIIGISHATIHYGLWIGIGVIIAGFLVRAWASVRKRPARLGRLDTSFPDHRPADGQFAMARFCRMLGTLLGAGVPLVQG